jgi:hypothetical protein
MKAVYRLTDGDTNKGVNANELGTDLGIPPEDMDAAIQYLTNEGDLRLPAMSLIALTQAGLRRMEREDVGSAD